MEKFREKQIERYASNLMQGEERLRFEEELQQDPNLRQLVQDEKLLQRAIQLERRKRLKSRILEQVQPTAVRKPPENRKLNYARAFIIAASTLIALCAIYHWQNCMGKQESQSMSVPPIIEAKKQDRTQALQKTKKQALNAVSAIDTSTSHSKPKVAQVSTKPRSTKPVANRNNQAANRQLIARFFKHNEDGNIQTGTLSADKREDKPFDLYNTAYKNKDYDAVLELWTELNIEEKSSKPIRFKYGVSLIGKSFVLDAKHIFEDLAKIPAYEIQSRWYLALISLYKNDLETCKTQLNHIISKNQNYTSEATQLLTEVNNL